MKMDHLHIDNQGDTCFVNMSVDGVPSVFNIETADLTEFIGIETVVDDLKGLKEQVETEPEE